MGYLLRGLGLVLLCVVLGATGALAVGYDDLTADQLDRYADARAVGQSHERAMEHAQREMPTSRSELTPRQQADYDNARDAGGLTHEEAMDYATKPIGSAGSDADEDADAIRHQEEAARDAARKARERARRLRQQARTQTGGSGTGGSVLFAQPPPFRIDPPLIVTGGWGRGQPTTIQPYPFFPNAAPPGDLFTPVTLSSGPTTPRAGSAAENARAARYFGGVFQNALGTANPGLLQRVNQNLANDRNPNVAAAEAYARALAAADPSGSWITQYPILLNTLLSDSTARRVILANFAQQMPESVLASNPWVLIEGIRIFTEKDDSELWHLVEVHFSNNWTKDTPDSVTVLESLDRWNSHWMEKYPKLIGVFMSDPHTRAILMERRQTAIDTTRATMIDGMKTRFDQNIYALAGYENYQTEVLYGGLLTQQQVITDLTNFRTRLAGLANLTDAQKAAYIDNASSAAMKINDAHVRMVTLHNAATTTRDQFGNPTHDFLGLKQDEWEKLIKRGKHAEAAETQWGQYLQAQTEYLALLDQNPILALSNHALGPDSYFYDKIINTNFAPGLGEIFSTTQSKKVDLFNSFINANVTEVQSKIEEISSINTAEALVELGGGQYRRAQDKVRASMNALGLLQASGWVSVLQGKFDLKEAESVYYNAIVDGSLTVVSIVGWYIPFIGPELAIAANLIMVGSAGGELYIAYGDATDAATMAGVAGHRYAMTADDRLLAAGGKMVFVSVAAAADIGIGLWTLKGMDELKLFTNRHWSPMVAKNFSWEEFLRMPWNAADDVAEAGLRFGDDFNPIFPGAKVGDAPIEPVKLAGFGDDVNELATNASPFLPINEIEDIANGVKNDSKFVFHDGDLTPEGFAQINNELTVAILNAQDATILVNAGPGGRLPGGLMDLGELEVFAGRTPPLSVMETDLTLLAELNAKTMLRPKHPGAGATPQQLATYQDALQAWENGWSVELIQAGQRAIQKSDEELLSFWSWNPYEAMGNRTWRPGDLGGFVPTFQPIDVKNLRAAFAGGAPNPQIAFHRPTPGFPVNTGPRAAPPAGWDEAATNMGPRGAGGVAPPRPGMDLEATNVGPLGALDETGVFPNVLPIPGVPRFAGSGGVREGMLAPSQGAAIVDELVQPNALAQIGGGNPVGGAMTADGMRGFLQGNDLMPRTSLQIGDQTFFFSKPFKGIGEKPSYLMFTRGEDGTMRIRYVVESGSGGHWRTIPFDTPAPGTPYGKGPIGFSPLADGPVYAFEDALAEAVEMQPFLYRGMFQAGDLPVIPAFRRTVPGILEDATAGVKAAKNTLRSLGDKFPDLMIPVGEYGKVGGWASKTPFDAALPGNLPDLANPLGQFRYGANHELFPNAQAFIVPSKNGKYRYMIVREAGENGRILTPVVQEAGGKINSFGARVQTPQAGNLTAPGFEYPRQLQRGLEGAIPDDWARIGEYVKVENHHTPFTDYLRENWQQLETSAAARANAPLHETQRLNLGPNGQVLSETGEPLTRPLSLDDTWFDAQNIAPNLYDGIPLPPAPIAVTPQTLPYYDLMSVRGSAHLPPFLLVGEAQSPFDRPPFLRSTQPMTFTLTQPYLQPNGSVGFQPAPGQQVSAIPFSFDNTAFPQIGDPIQYGGFGYTFPKGISDANGKLSLQNVPITTVPNGLFPNFGRADLRLVNAATTPLYNLGPAGSGGHGLDFHYELPNQPFGGNPFGPSGGPGLGISNGAWNANIGSGETKSLLVGGPGFDPSRPLIDGGLGVYFGDTFTFGGGGYQTYFYPEFREEQFLKAGEGIDGNLFAESNRCIDAAPYVGLHAPSPPGLADDWVLGAVDAESVHAAKGPGTIVAVVDTGLDWRHPEIAPENVWRNEDEIPGNGIDDDHNGYVDDVIGWDFVERDNKPWDYDGHGTLVSGIIAARDDGIGTRGIDPGARIMVLKALNNLKQGRAGYVAEAIAYAADNGARVVNLSMASKRLTKIERMAVDYATGKGVLVVAASGNAGEQTSEYAPGAYPGVLTVAATDPQGERAGFSNWGEEVDLAAPGVDVVGPRARGTDLMAAMPGLEYESGANILGGGIYYRATGTSFAAPIVSGAASLLLSHRPELTAEQARRMLRYSARDVGTPGTDWHTGLGLLDVAAALAADPEFFIEVAIDGVEVVEEGGERFLDVKGTLLSDQLDGGTLSIGKGEAPSSWKTIHGSVGEVAPGGSLGRIPVKEIGGANVWTIRIEGRHKDGKVREAQFRLELG